MCISLYINIYIYIYIYIHMFVLKVDIILETRPSKRAMMCDVQRPAGARGVCMRMCICTMYHVRPMLVRLRIRMV